MVIAEKRVELRTGILRLGNAGSPRRRGIQNEGIAEIGSVLLLDLFGDGFPAVPMAPGGVEPAVKTNFGVFSAGRTGGAAINFKFLGKSCATVKATSHEGMIHFSFDVCNDLTACPEKTKHSEDSMNPEVLLALSKGIVVRQQCTTANSNFRKEYINEGFRRCYQIMLFLADVMQAAESIE